jgi:D-alanyl-D-alanine carboxypeptidase/D-alanyl-D-alanine-endopeptidase (penicillin-binding protein 4)
MWSSSARTAVLLAMLLSLASIDPATAESQEPAGAGQGGDLVDRVTWLVKNLEDEVHRRAGDLPGARIGIAVRDLATGQLLFGSDQDGLYNLASNTKLVTTACALAKLGPGFRWRTGLYAGPIDATGQVTGDLYLRGRGDPTLGTHDLDALVDDLVLAGVTRIKGAIAVDVSYFDDADSPPHFDEQPKEQASFRAPIGATSLNFNAVKIVARPAPSGAGPAVVAVEPATDYVLLTSQVTTVRRGRNRIRVDTKVVKHQLVVTVRGQLRWDSGVVSVRRRVPDPAHYVAGALRARLAARGIAVGKKSTVLATVPLDATLLAEHESPALAVVIRDLGKFSNNFVAEMLLKTVGAETVAQGQRPATWADGLATERRFLIDEVGLADGGFYVGNGSGLFTASKLSPSQVTRLLAVAYRDFRYGPDFMTSLSISATDGTLSRRMAAGPAAHLVRAKTGTLDGVSALSGYVALDGRAPLAFAVLVNGNAPGSSSRARALQDRVSEVLAHYLEATGQGEPSRTASGTDGPAGGGEATAAGDEATAAGGEAAAAGGGAEGTTGGEAEGTAGGSVDSE